MSKTLEFVQLVSEGRHEEAKDLFMSMLDEACKNKMYEEEGMEDEDEESEVDDTEEVEEKPSDETKEDK